MIFFKLLLFKYIIFILQSYRVAEKVDKSIEKSFIHCKGLLFRYQTRIYFCEIFLLVSKVLLFYQQFYLDFEKTVEG